MLSSKDVIHLTTTPRSGLHRGKVEFLKQRLQTPTTSEEAAQKSLLESLLTQPAEGLSTYAHPGRDAQAVAGLSPQLTASDLAWLQRLPTEPDQIRYEDARTLAGMAQATPLGSSDRRLVDSIWAPVKNLHDVAQAKVELANATAAAVPTPPAATTNVLTAALAREMPMLTPDEASARARALLQEAVDKQSESRRKVRDAAAQKLADLRASGATA